MIKIFNYAYTDESSRVAIVEKEMHVLLDPGGAAHVDRGDLRVQEVGQGHLHREQSEPVGRNAAL